MCPSPAHTRVVVQTTRSSLAHTHTHTSPLLADYLLGDRPTLIELEYDLRRFRAGELDLFFGQRLQSAPAPVAAVAASQLQQGGAPKTPGPLAAERVANGATSLGAAGMLSPRLTVRESNTIADIRSPSIKTLEGLAFDRPRQEEPAENKELNEAQPEVLMLELPRP